MTRKYLILIMFSALTLHAQDNTQTQNNNTMNINMLPISVTIGGDFIITGSFTAYATQRMDHFLTLTFNTAKAEILSVSNDPEYAAVMLSEFEKYKFDNLILKRSDGSEITINLDEFRETGNFKHNPYLKNDDVIIFPKTEVNKYALISITIGGEFFVTGSFRTPASQRVDELVTRLYNETKQNAMSNVKDEIYLQKLNEQFSDYSTRNITLVSAEGKNSIIDLEKFRLNGDYKNNPFLQNGDVLIFPRLDLEKNFIQITGAVNNPRIIQYVDGDYLSDAIDLSMGLNPAYENVDSAKISRLNYEGDKEEIIVVNIQDDFKLQRGDRIKILADETQKRNFSVYIAGEVEHPGYIYITKDNTTITEVIEKAGGFTDKAWLKKSKIIRGIELMYADKNKLYNEYELFQIDRDIEMNHSYMSRMSNLHVEDTAYFRIENELRLYNEFGITDFTYLEDSESELSNTIVKDGDIIMVPEFENVVYVFGQVANTGKYGFKEGAEYEYYIELAGGESDEADYPIMLIKGNSKRWIDVDYLDDENKIEPGDYVWVPKAPVRNFNFHLGRVAAIAGIIGSVSATILLLGQLNN